jgi:sec-independent protein translocase protein TatA
MGARYAARMSFGPLELLIVLVIILLLFGGRRLPALGRQLGDGLREFKDSVTRRTGDQYDAADERRQVAGALGRSEQEGEPVDGEVVRERR